MNTARSIRLAQLRVPDTSCPETTGTEDPWLSTLC